MSSLMDLVSASLMSILNFSVALFFIFSTKGNDYIFDDSKLSVT